MTGPDSSSESANAQKSATSDLGSQKVFVSRRQPALFLNGKTIPLSVGREYILGRDKESCNVVIPDERISRQHACIFSRDGRYFIKDLGSLNGTFVNRERIASPLGLLPGDEIIIPPQKLLFVLHDQQYGARVQPTATETDKQRSHFSGLLHALLISDLIQLLNSTMQSGVLTVQDPERRTGRVFFLHGEIVAARYEEKSQEDAVYALLRIKKGSFEFIRENITMPENPIKTRTISLLLEGCRLADEATVHESNPPPPKV